jgi:hypothetical protein
MSCAGPQSFFGNNFEFSYNIALDGTQGDCNYNPADILGTAWTGTNSITTNLVANLTDIIEGVGPLTRWKTFGHATVIAVDEASIGLAKDELTLLPTSPYHGKGIGANLSCFNEAAIRAGTPSPLCPLPPEVRNRRAVPPSGAAR